MQGNKAPPSRAQRLAPECQGPATCRQLWSASVDQRARVLRTLSPFSNQTFLDRNLHKLEGVRTANRHHSRTEPFSGTRSSFCADVPLVYSKVIHSRLYTLFCHCLHEDKLLFQQRLLLCDPARYGSYKHVGGQGDPECLPFAHVIVHLLACLGLIECLGSAFIWRWFASFTVDIKYCTPRFLTMSYHCCSIDWYESCEA